MKLSPKYVLVLVDLFSSKVYIYPMKSRKQIRQKLEQFHRDVRSKRKNKKSEAVSRPRISTSKNKRSK